MKAWELSRSNSAVVFVKVSEARVDISKWLGWDIRRVDSYTTQQARTRYKALISEGFSLVREFEASTNYAGYKR